MLAQGVFAPGFVKVICPQYGTDSAIDDRPVLRVRPGDDLPLLLGTSLADLVSEDISPAVKDLYANAQLAMAGDTLGVQLPAIRIPRALLAVVVARVPDDGAADPDLAYGQVTAQWSEFSATSYRMFFTEVLGSSRLRAVNRPLQQAWSGDPASLAEFVETHPDLLSPEVVAAVAKDVDAGPPMGGAPRLSLHVCSWCRRSPLGWLRPPWWRPIYRPCRTGSQRTWVPRARLNWPAAPGKAVSNGRPAELARPATSRAVLPAHSNNNPQCQRN